MLSSNPYDSVLDRTNQCSGSALWGGAEGSLERVGRGKTQASHAVPWETWGGVKIWEMTGHRCFGMQLEVHMGPSQCSNALMSRCNSLNPGATESVLNGVTKCSGQSLRKLIS